MVICCFHRIRTVHASNLVYADHEEVPLHELFVMGLPTYIVHAPYVIARLNRYKWQNNWWPGGLSVVASALWGTHFGEVSGSPVKASLALLRQGMVIESSARNRPTSLDSYY